MAGDINGNKVRQRRLELGLSRRELSQRTLGHDHIVISTIASIEDRGNETHRAQPRTARALAKALGTDLSKLR
jgi:transcriptional regulator with XRE-family HTH domain